MFGKCKGCHELADQVGQLQKSLDEHRLRITQLEGMDIEHLEKHVDEMRFEWDKWYNKFRSLYANMSRRAKDHDDDVRDDREPINPAAAALLDRGL